MSPVRFEQPRDAELAHDGTAFFDTPLGRDLEAAEMRILRQRLADGFGARALLLGAGLDERLLDALHVQRRHVGRIAEVDAPTGGHDPDPASDGAEGYTDYPTRAG